MYDTNPFAMAPGRVGRGGSLFAISSLWRAVPSFDVGMGFRRLDIGMEPSCAGAGVDPIVLLPRACNHEPKWLSLGNPTSCHCPELRSRRGCAQIRQKMAAILKRAS